MSEKKRSWALSLSSRKLIISTLAIVIVGLFVDIDPAAKVDFIKWIVGFYLVSNVGARFADRIGGKA